jgi:uncharacterized protein (TIGR00288 family)
MQEKLNIAVFVDYDNIEIGVKSTLRTEFDVSLPLGALRERGDIVAKFAYANWSRQEQAARQMAENAVQMVQRNPSPRGDKNGADINLALDALEMAFTHRHVNAFAIVSGDSDFVPLVNKLKEYGKTVMIVGGKQFTSTILQQNCHEFISYEGLLDAAGVPIPAPRVFTREAIPSGAPTANAPGGGSMGQVTGDRLPRERRQRPAPLELSQVTPLVDRALQVLERRNVQPQLGLLKSTMLQLDSSFNERAYGAHSFSEFVEKLAKTEFIRISGQGGRMLIERKSGGVTGEVARPEEALPILRDFLENHREELEEGEPESQVSEWFAQEHTAVDLKKYGFQQLGEFLVFAQDKGVVRLRLDEAKGQIVSLGAEFYPPAAPPEPEPKLEDEVEEDGPQPFVAGQPTMMDPNPAPPPSKRTARPRTPRKTPGGGGNSRTPTKRTPRKRKD